MEQHNQLVWVSRPITHVAIQTYQLDDNIPTRIHRLDKLILDCSTICKT